VSSCRIYEEDIKAHLRLLMRGKVKVSRVVLSLTVPLLIRANKGLMMRGDLIRKMLMLRLSTILVV